MAAQTSLSIPTTARIASSVRLSSNCDLVQKTLGRLSRASLVQLALDWLDERSDGVSFPVLSTGLEDTSDFYPPMDSLDELLNLYEAIQERKGPKREVLDRILEGDWRAGITMYQLAMADLQYLYDHPNSQRWSVYCIIPLQTTASSQENGVDVYSVDNKSMEVPRFHPSSFLEKLYSEVLPGIKSHCHFDRHRSHPLLVLRLFIFDSPYGFNEKAIGGLDEASLESAKTVYIAFPDAAPFIYISKPQSYTTTSTTDNKTINSLLIKGIPKALSKPRQRYTLTPTGFSSNNLNAVLKTNSSSRANSAGGGWSIYADERAKETPLHRVLPTPPSDDSTAKTPGIDEAESRAMMRRLKVAEGRFGLSALPGDKNGIERFDVTLKAPTTVDDDDNAHDDDEPLHVSMRLCFSGSHVFAGIRQLVEAGAINGEAMPGWLTGEDSVTVGTVEDGVFQGPSRPVV